MGIPAWALMLGGAKILPEMADNWLGLYRNVQQARSDGNAYDAERALQGMNSSKDALAYDPGAAGYVNRDDYSKLLSAKKNRAEYLQGIEANPVINALNTAKANGWQADQSFTPDEWTKGLLDLQGVQTDPLNPVMNSAVDKFRQGARSQNDMENTLSSINDSKPLDPITSARLALDPNVQATHNAGNNVLTAIEKGIGRQEKSDFANTMQNVQSDLTGLSGKSLTGADKERMGYMTPVDYEGEARRIAAQYPDPNGKVNELISKAIDDYRQFANTTYMPTETVQVGRTTASGQRNISGDWKPDVKSVAPVINVNASTKEDKKTASWQKRINQLSDNVNKAFDKTKSNNPVDTATYNNARRILQNAINATEKQGIDVDLGETGMDFISNRPQGKQKQTQPAGQPDLATAQKLVQKYGGDVGKAQAAYAKGER
jgi:hypothetical protein